MGAMQSWLPWNMSVHPEDGRGVELLTGVCRIGLYPVPGQTMFLVGSPWFKDMSIDLGDGKSLNVTSTGGDSDSVYFVRSLKVNGQQWDKAWVTRENIFANGGTVDFVLGSEMTRWTTGERPPSPANWMEHCRDDGDSHVPRSRHARFVAGVQHLTSRCKRVNP